jgi:hypothetical protein
MAKRTVLLSLVIAALFLTVIAQDSRNRTGHLPERSRSGPASEFKTSKALFYQLVSEATPTGKQKVQFHVRVDGLAHFAELITVSADEAQRNPAVEFLATDSQRLEQLYAAAEQGRQISIGVLVNGKLAEEFSFDEFLSYNRLLKMNRSFAPAPTKTQVFVLRPLGPENEVLSAQEESGEDCQQRCDEEYSNCSVSLCGAPTDFCEPCLQAWNDCRDSCPPIDPPEPICQTSYWSRATPVSASWRGWFCFEDIFGQPSQYDRYWVTYKVEQFRRVTCGSNIQDTLISVSYYGEYCDRNTFLWCSFPDFGFPYSPC